MGYCINKLKIFLAENKVPTLYQRTILRAANNGQLEKCIDYGVAWSNYHGYYFWCFLQLKWIVTLIKDRKNCSLILTELTDLIKKYNDYIISYGWSESYGVYYNKGEYLIKKSKYIYIYKKYCDYIKFHDKKFG